MRKHLQSSAFSARTMGLFLFILVGLSACGETSAPTIDTPPPLGIEGHENPLMAVWETDFGVPPFDQIENDHYIPAFREAMELHRTEIDVVVNNPEPPTFENTVFALDLAGALYSRVGRVFGAVNGAHTNDVLQEVARTMAPERAAHGDAIGLNPGLWERVNAVFEQKDELGLTPEQSKLLEETHKGFVRSGAALDEISKARIMEINSELAELSIRFGENVLGETNSYELLVTDTADLGALPANLVTLAAERARGSGHDTGWAFGLDRPSINPFLEYSTNRDLRRDIFMGYALRGDNDNAHDNKTTLARMAALRAEKAQIMGYPTHAHFIISDNMAETPNRVLDFLEEVWRPALAVAKRERADMQELMNSEGIPGKLEGWDWRHYTEKVRKARFALDQEALLPFFEVNAVRDGVFMISNRLYGFSFHEREDLPRWHPDQQVFEVREADGSHLGVLYMDFFTRPSKRGGAWMNSLRSQSNVSGFVTPIVTTNFNFPPATEDGPSLIGLDNAMTLAHEMGHALHGLMSNVTFEALSGTSVPRDFVEFGSQIMENWMGEPEVLREYAKHYETGEVIPDDFVDKLQASATFNQGFITVEFIAAAFLDMAWHLLEEPVEHDADAFENAEMARVGLIEEIIPRYRSTYYNHIFSGGYSAGYYAYLWAEVLDKDAFQAFVEAGDLFDSETSDRLRDEILSRGGTLPGMELYVNFRGREPSIQALLEARGLVGVE
ncbi:MAG: M3 family metallopeptidase [Gemmatimonadetes bacterium]|nr:M3 family metallopeptidase [Gemmatimonadota bacterium]NNM06427.1 M3 family metallopeptidase [Gemmatimonadota bacterium]